MIIKPAHGTCGLARLAIADQQDSALLKSCRQQFVLRHGFCKIRDQYFRGQRNALSTYQPQKESIMTCEHLRKLYQLCQTHDLKISSSDVVRVVCSQCEETEVCPSMLTDEYDARQPQPKDAKAT